MFSILDWFKIGTGVCAGIVITSIYWLGVPLLNDYPVLKNIPLIGKLAVGHVDTIKADAVKSYVLLTEKTAVEARARELERQINAAAQSLEEYRKRAVAAEKVKEEANERLEKLIAEDGGDDGLRWNDTDIEWLRQH